MWPKRAASRHTTHAMWAAVHSRRSDIVLHLLRLGAPPDDPDGRQSYLALAISVRDPVTAEILLWAGASLDLAIRLSLRSVAHLYGQPNAPDHWCVDMLLSALDVKRLVQQGVPILALALPSPALIRHLVARGADPNEKKQAHDWPHSTVLLAAIREGNAESALTLLQLGASTCAPPSVGGNSPQPPDPTLVHFACKTDALASVTKELLCRGVPCHSAEPSPVSLAARSLSLANLTLLLDCGAPIQDVHHALTTAASLRDSDAQLRVVELLVLHGAQVSANFLQSRIGHLRPPLAALMLLACAGASTAERWQLARSMGARIGEEEALLTKVMAACPLRAKLP